MMSVPPVPAESSASPRSARSPVLSARGLGRLYPSPGGDVWACRAVDLAVYPGEFVVLRGRSGAGKTTLLNLLGGLDHPTEGEVLVAGKDIAALPEPEMTALRRLQLGYVFQSFGLLPVLSAAENVEVPLRIQRVARAERETRVKQALAMVGLSRQARQRPDELSGGQQQRVGVARAIVSRPRILIADEPTGQLDSVTAAGIIDLISDLVLEQGLAAVVSTHYGAMSDRAGRVLQIQDGRVTVVR